MRRTWKIWGAWEQEGDEEVADGEENKKKVAEKGEEEDVENR